MLKQTHVAVCATMLAAWGAPAACFRNEAG